MYAFHKCVKLFFFIDIDLFIYVSNGKRKYECSLHVARGDPFRSLDPNDETISPSSVCDRSG